jgi:hypothetical protein
VSKEQDYEERESRKLDRQEREEKRERFEPPVIVKPEVLETLNSKALERSEEERNKHRKHWGES